MYVVSTRLDRRKFAAIAKHFIESGAVIRSRSKLLSMCIDRLVELLQLDCELSDAEATDILDRLGASLPPKSKKEELAEILLEGMKKNT